MGNNSEKIGWAINKIATGHHSGVAAKIIAQWAVGALNNSGLDHEFRQDHPFPAHAEVAR